MPARCHIYQYFSSTLSIRITRGDLKNIKSEFQFRPVRQNLWEWGLRLSIRKNLLKPYSAVYYTYACIYLSYQRFLRHVLWANCLNSA